MKLIVQKKFRWTGLGALFVAGILASFCRCTIAQTTPPDIVWQRAVGGSGEDHGECVISTSDGGFVIGGYSNSTDGDFIGGHGGIDYAVAKFDALHNLQWAKCYGGSADDYLSTVRQTSDGGFLLLGYTRSNDSDVTGNHGGSDLWVVRLDATGAIIWSRTLGGSADDQTPTDASANCLQLTRDGGFIIAAFSSSTDGQVHGNHAGSIDYWIVKLDSVGGILWDKCYGGSGVDYATGIQQTDGAGFIIGGFASSTDGDVIGNHGNWDFWPVRIDSVGTLVWQRSFGGSDRDEMWCLHQTSDGGFISCGFSFSSDGDVTDHHGTGAFVDAWVVRQHYDNNLDWKKSLGGSGHDGAYDVQETPDGGFLLCGDSHSIDGDVDGNHSLSGTNDYWLVKLSERGERQWQQMLGGTGLDNGVSFAQRNNGGVIVIGSSASDDGDVSGNHGGNDMWVVELNNTPQLAIDPPQIEWQRMLGGAGDEECTALVSGADNSLLVVGYSGSSDSNVAEHHGSADSTDYWLVDLTRKGKQVWAHSFGGFNFDQVYAATRASDGNYIVAGQSWSGDGDVTDHRGSTGTYEGDFWIVKISTAGVLIWQKSLGGSSNDGALGIAPTNDGGCFVTGYSYSNDIDVSGHHGTLDSADAWIIKLDGSGTLVWQRSGGGNGYDFGEAVAATSDGGCIVTGEVHSADSNFIGFHGGYSDIFVVKLTDAGIEEWEKFLGGSAADFPRAIMQTADGDYLVAGGTNSIDGDISGNAGGYDAWIVKLGATGNRLWRKSFGGTANDQANAIAAISDSGILVSGASRSLDGDAGLNRGSQDAWLYRLTKNGNILWHKTIGGTGTDYANAEIAITDSEYVIAGVSNSNDFDVSGGHGGDDYWVARLGYQPRLSVNDSIAFVTQPCDSVVFDTLWVRNTGVKPLVISNVHIPTGIVPSGFGFIPSSGANTIDSLPVSIQPGDSIGIVIAYDQFVNQQTSWPLDLTTNDSLSGANPRTVTLAAVFDSSHLTPDIAALEFDSVFVGAERCISIPYTAMGRTGDTIVLVTRDSGSAQFICTSPSSLVIPPGDSDSLHVCFKPNTVGDAEARFTVLYKPCNQTCAIVVKGTGVRGSLDSVAVSTTSLAFGAVLECGGRTTDTVFVVNAGTTPFNAQCTVGGTNATDFIVDNSATSPFALQPGESKGVSVKFTPHSHGAKNATMIVGTDNPLIPNDTIAISAIADTADITLQSDTLNAGDVHISASACIPVTVQAAGGVDDTIVGVTSTDNLAFTLSTPLPHVVRAGTLDSLTICFSPQGEGTRQSTFTLTTTPCDHARAFTVIGHGSKGVLNLSPNTLNFGTLDLCVTQADTISVRNISAVAQHVSCTIGGVNRSDYQLLSPDTFSIAPGASNSLAVLCNAKADGQRSAYLAFTSVGSVVNADTLLLTVTQTASPLKAARTEVDWSSDTTVNAGDMRDTTIAVFNSGSTKFRINTVTCGDGFNVNANSLPRTLLPGDSLNVHIQFAPTVNKTYTTHVAVQVDSPCAMALQIFAVGSAAASSPGTCAASANLRVTIADSASVGSGFAIPIEIITESNLDNCNIAQFVWRLRYHRSVLIPDPTQTIGNIDSSSDIGADHILVIHGARSSGHSQLAQVVLIAALGDTNATTIASEFEWLNTGTSTITRQFLQQNIFHVANICTQGGARYFIAGPSPTLAQNRPNPFVDQTTFEFDVAEKGRAKLLVHDMLGRECGVVMDEELSPGHYVRDFSAKKLPAGMYVYSLQTATSVQRREMVVGK